jgi:hypothetical protein
MTLFAALLCLSLTSCSSKWHSFLHSKKHTQTQSKQHYRVSQHQRAHRRVALKEPMNAPRKPHYGHRFIDPQKGQKQPSVRHIDAPEPLKSLPRSTVLETQQLPMRFELAKVFELRPFHTIAASNDINITLRNSDTPRVAILDQGHPGLNLVQATVKNGTLYLKEVPRPPVGSTRPMQVLVEANNIHLIYLRDKSSITADNYHSNRFDIISATSGDILLHTQLDIRHIEHHGKGMISIDWIKTPSLDIFTEGSGLIRVAGSTNTLHIRAVDNGKVDAKYLRTEDALVQTCHQAEVAVRPHYTLNAFASGHSYIYYYKTPEFFIPRNYGSGNILQMRYWD